MKARCRECGQKKALALLLLEGKQVPVCLECLEKPKEENDAKRAETEATEPTPA